MRTQQEKLYVAERFGDRGETFTDLLDVAAWVGHAMLDQPWWPERFPCVRGIRVVAAGRRHGSVGAWFADDCTGQVEMSPEHWSQQYLCHEVAHVCARATDAESHGHDPVFTRIYLELVFRTMGEAAWRQLRDSFIAHQIEFG